VERLVDVTAPATEQVFRPELMQRASVRKLA
jgi:hypothetical protein